MAHYWHFAALTTPGMATPLIADKLVPGMEFEEIVRTHAERGEILDAVALRRMVQLNYLDESPLAVAAQRISRFGTHFMKNVLRIR